MTRMLECVRKYPPLNSRSTMFKTLSAKLTAVLLGLLGLIGLVYISLSLFSTQMYLQEVNQQLNRSLAQHLVSEKILIEGNQINQAALEELFHMLMVINPNIEIYLLDPAGKVLACSAPIEKLKHKQVSLLPIKRFLDGSQPMPILGDDPQDLHRQKVFSAAPIPVKAAAQQILPNHAAETRQISAPAIVNGPIAGYLYVVLGGKAYDSVAQMLQGSYILRLSTWIIVASVALTLLAGIVLFRFLTHRLTRLTQAMETFKQADFAEPAALTQVPGVATRQGDEIDRLGATFNQMAERIQQQMQGLKKTDLLRRELVANVSHDLRTPLASLQGYLETLLLKEGSLSARQQRDYLEIALRHSERLGKLVSELFELAKLDAQLAPLALEPFSLSELVQDVVQEFQLAAQKKGVTLRAELRKDAPFVRADIGMMERVLENLIENALRYTPEAGAVTVSIMAAAEFITLQVTDTGCGIPAADLPHIFDRFYRVEKARQDNGDGAGLGLAIAKRILDLHGSLIEAHSVSGQGTTFRFYLPAWRADLPA